MTTVRGTRVWTDDRDSLAAAVETVLESRLSDLRDADEIAVVPDAHYPFHPSTGMVTDPDVVGATVGVLERETTADVAVVGRSGPHIDDDRTIQYLGYESVLADASAEYESLDEAATRSVRRRVDGEPVTAAVPEPLLDRAVVVLPSLRPIRAGPVAGARRTLDRVVTPDADADRIAIATARIVDPVVALLDATVAFAGEPVAADALFAGDDAAVDAVAATLLDRDPADDAVIAAATDDGPLSVTVEGIDLDAVAETLPSGGLPPSASPHPLVSGGYRLYAAVSGDAVPPQLDGGS